jgi:hypothetical protein
MVLAVIAWVLLVLLVVSIAVPETWPYLGRGRLILICIILGVLLWHVFGMR